MHRFAIIRTLLRMGQDPKIAAGDLSDVHQAMQSGTLGLTAAAQGLSDGATVLDQYLGPLHGACSPRMWGFGISRQFGQIIFSFGKLVNGRAGRTRELLQTLQHSHSDSTPPPQVAGHHIAAAIDWWGGRLNQLFAWLSDAALFADSTGEYRPGPHLQTLLSVEQVFRRVTSILASDRDSTAALGLMYTVLDTLTGRLMRKTLDTLLTYKSAAKTLEEIRTVMPLDAHPVLLDHAERSVAALLRVQDGFCIPAARPSPGQLEVQLPDGTTRGMSIDRAAMLYLTVLRNATHGFGAREGKSAEVNNALLLHHTGQLDHDLAGLAYLYLLEMLIHPERVREALDSA